MSKTNSFLNSDRGRIPVIIGSMVVVYGLFFLSIAFLPTIGMILALAGIPVGWKAVTRFEQRVLSGWIIWGTWWFWLIWFFVKLLIAYALGLIILPFIIGKRFGTQAHDTMSANATAAGSALPHKSTAHANQDQANLQRHIANLQAAAQGGNIDAMYNLGRLYSEGQYVAIDLNTVCYWWTCAAERGHVYAQYALACLYNGEVSASYYDKNQAWHWVNVAANNGHPNALQRLGR